MRVEWGAVGAFLLACILFYLMWTPVFSLYVMGTQAAQYGSLLGNHDLRLQKIEKWVIEQQNLRATTTTGDKK